MLCLRSLIHSTPSYYAKSIRRRVHLPPQSSVRKDLAVSESDKQALEFLAERGRALGVRLSASERALIAKEAAQNNGKMKKEDWHKLVSRRHLETQERLTLSSYLAQSHDRYLGQHVLQWTARLGVAFFAMTGAHIAGETGMHVVGSTLVGCVTALGGGTVNSLMTGNTPVGWVRNPAFLMITMGSSLIGFYIWPLVEQNVVLSETSETIRYVLESVALGSLAVVGAQSGIVAGCHPLVSSALGVTVAFGGVLRDLMCGRDLSLGAATGCQSYGIASFSGAAVYVALRELHVWNCAGSTTKLVHGGIPIGLRILIGFGTVFAIRLIAWQYKPDGILLTMEESAAANQKRLEWITSLWQSEDPK